MKIQSAISAPYTLSQGDLSRDTYGVSDMDTPGPVVQAKKIESIDRSEDISPPVQDASPGQKETQPDPENTSQGQPSQQQDAQPPAVGADNTQLSPEELRLVEELKQIDTEVRTHEMAHVAAGGNYITSGANFTYKKGPDGKDYAVGGEVGIDTSPVPGDPEATIQKMNQVRQAALAPASPSAQDRKVAAQASSQAVKAQAELTILRAQTQKPSEEGKEEENDTQASDIDKKAATDAYIQVSGLPEIDSTSFQIAV